MNFSKDQWLEGEEDQTNEVCARVVLVVFFLVMFQRVFHDDVQTRMTKESPTAQCQKGGKHVFVHVCRQERPTTNEIVFSRG